MKIAYYSDLHLEFFGNRQLPNFPAVDAEVLIVAGDIVSMHKYAHTVDFWHTISEQYEVILYVLGNHEHYGGDINTTRYRLEHFFKYNFIDNVVILENEVYEYKDTVFFGATFWANPIYPNVIANSLNDYIQITDGVAIDGGLKFVKIAKTINKYHETIDSLEYYANKDTNLVVISHNAPTMESVSKAYIGSNINEGFANRLDSLILANPSIKLWVHGHTHNASDYYIGTTHVVANPIGYFGHEHYLTEYTPKVVEL